MGNVKWLKMAAFAVAVGAGTIQVPACSVYAQEYVPVPEAVEGTEINESGGIENGGAGNAESGGGETVHSDDGKPSAIEGPAGEMGPVGTDSTLHVQGPGNEDGKHGSFDIAAVSPSEGIVEAADGMDAGDVSNDAGGNSKEDVAGGVVTDNPSSDDATGGVVLDNPSSAVPDNTAVHTSDNPASNVLDNSEHDGPVDNSSDAVNHSSTPVPEQSTSDASDFPVSNVSNIPTSDVSNILSSNAPDIPTFKDSENTTSDVADTGGNVTGSYSGKDTVVIDSADDRGEDSKQDEDGSNGDGGKLFDIPKNGNNAIAGILSDMDPEVLETLLKNPKLLGYIIPDLHVTVSDGSVTIVPEGAEKQEPGEPVWTGKVRTNGGRLNVRTGSGTASEIISALANGTEVQVKTGEDGWYELVFPGGAGYVSGQYLVLDGVIPGSVEEDKGESYSFDADSGTVAVFLSGLSSLFEEEPMPVPDPQGLTPDGNLSLMDDIGAVNAAGQQFVTLVTKAGNYFYLVIDRDEKGEENVHFLNMVDERDLFSLMDEDEQAAYREELTLKENARALEESIAAMEAKNEEAEKQAASDEERKEEKGTGKRKGSALPALVLFLTLAAGAGAWYLLQYRKKKRAENTPDPDADYMDGDDEDEDENGVYGYGAGGSRDAARNRYPYGKNGGDEYGEWGREDGIGHDSEDEAEDDADEEEED